jgi:hypothetical protein
MQKTTKLREILLQTVSVRVEIDTNRHIGWF